MPRLILEHNIYGVDIDPRAAQIASLALWLRAQRAWNDAGVKAQDRPRIGIGHVVAAVAPPAEVDLRRDVIRGMDYSDAILFEQTLSLLKALPELGVLLRAERDVPALVRQIFQTRGPIFRADDERQWRVAESRLRQALEEFAKTAVSSYRNRLFAEDAISGLRLIDIIQIKFDIIVMNPPFGLISEGQKDCLKKEYPEDWNDYYNIFLRRGVSLLNFAGYLGCVVPNRLLFAKKSVGIRKLFLDEMHVTSIVDAGRDVMDDAAVDAMFLTVSKVNATN